MGLSCKRCKSTEQVKNGLMRGKQRYRCKGCGLNFTDTPPPGKPLAMKVTAVLLLAITHIFPRQINALLTSSRSCPSALSWLKALRFE